MVLDSPVASATRAIPPRPSARASTAAQRRRVLSFSPDWAVMCKHAAAVLYGVGSRLDDRPELLFRLRDVDAEDLVVGDMALPDAAAGDDVLAGDLADIFGIDLDPADSGAAAARQRTTGRRRPRRGRPRRTGAPPSGFQPTGRRVAELRRRGGFSVPEFAGLLRVSASTVYRWEAARGPLALRAGQETATREGVSHECGLWGDPLCADAQNREKMLDTHRRRPVADRRRVHAVLCGAPPHLHGWARPARAQPGAELEIGGG